MSRLLKGLLLLLGLCYVVTSVPSTTVKSVLCNYGVYSKNGPFQKSLADVLDELEDVTHSRQGYDFRNISPYPRAFAYGHATCNQDVTASDCATCLGATKRVLLDTCQSRIGGRAVLSVCSMRYEQYPFDD